MSANLRIFTGDNSLSAVGSYRVVSYSDAFEKVTAITGYTDDISGETVTIFVQRSFRMSFNGETWSMWVNFSLADLTPLTGLVFDPEKRLFLEFKYEVIEPSDECGAGTPLSPDITINSLDVFMTRDASVVDPDNIFTDCECSSEFCVTPVMFNEAFTFNPYAVNAGVSLYKDLSKMVNNTFGHEVQYIRVIPSARGMDVVLHEHTIYNAQQQKCLKVLVPNNEFPDSKVNFNNFGIDFEIPFEIHIDRGYFESFFGKSTMPQMRDVIYFPLINRIYEISSSYLYRDFMQQGLYFKVALIKYQQRADTVMPSDLGAKLDQLTLSTSELFGEEVERESAKITKHQQYITITEEMDPTRASVNRLLPIARADVHNNWTLVSEGYYDLESLYNAAGSVVAVNYRTKAAMSASESRSFTCWFVPRDNTKAVDYSRPLLRGRNSAGQGLDIDLIFSGAAASPGNTIRVMWNNNQYDFDLGMTLGTSTWYALVVNLSNEFLQVGANLWKMHPKIQTSELRLAYRSVQTATLATFDIDQAYTIVASPILLTNVRLFNEMIEDEHQSNVLNQLIVNDADKALIIDNSKIILKLARVVNPR